MVKGFSFENVIFKKDTIEDSLTISGEIANNSGRDYSSIVFRLVILSKDIPLGHTMITINGISHGRKRRFEKMLPKLVYSEIINKITNYDVYLEGGY